MKPASLSSQFFETGGTPSAASLNTQILLIVIWASVKHHGIFEFPGDDCTCYEYENIGTRQPNIATL